MKKKISNRKNSIELLKQRYELDEENKLFDINLRLDNLDELVERSVSTDKKLFLNEDADDFILHYLRDIPSGYKCNMTLHIADYEGYEKKEVMNAFKDMVELNKIRFKKENRKKIALVILLVVAGLAFIVMSKTLLAGLFNSATMNSIVEETVDIIGWVFIWEAVTLLFLNPSEILKNAREIVFKLKSFKLK
jgi:hypothetical protein